MDMDIKAPKRAEIQQFLLDVREHFRASMEAPAYENTSNLFHVTAAEQTHELLERCDELLAGYTDEKAAATATAAATQSAPGTHTTTTKNCATQQAVIKPNGITNSNKVGAETGCYLEMGASSSAPTSLTLRNALSASREYIDLAKKPTLHTDKAFEPEMKLQNEQDLEQEQQLYDICQNQTMDETQQVFAHELFINCPLANLPAGHLPLHGATKYGQLLRIEKRMFFDQTKKFYCGILFDWFLCYSDGQTSSKPCNTLYLKSSAIEVEHFGEGKRRELCFQITTADPGKKFLYQANNEVDAKEWIHAIEAAIRGDEIALFTCKSLRKLPTPPMSRKSSYISAITITDSIYEEPSPIYNLGNEVPTTPPSLPDKCNSALAKRFDYDIPRSPPQPLAVLQDEPANTEVETAELLKGDVNVAGVCEQNSSALNEIVPQQSSLHGSLVKDFQTNLKAVHSELSSQLTSPERLKMVAKKNYSCGNSETEMLSLTNPQPTAIAVKEQKKQKKSQTANASPQKTPSKDCDKLARNWFLSRLNKSSTGQSTRSANSSSGIVNINATSTPTNAKCKQSEKENLLNGLDICDGNHDPTLNERQPSSNPTSPCLKSDSKSKVNMIINQFESSGHLSTMFSVEALAANALASLTSFCESDNCNNYEPIMPLATTPSSFLKKV